MNLASHAQLSEAIEKERRKATVRSLDLSFNEMADMYETGELHINPDYQRSFRWSAAKQSQFIESIILEMPVPPIYAVEVDEGRWELIDGLQRLSTYLHLRSILKITLEDGTEKYVPGKDKLILEHCDIIPTLNGYSFDELTTSAQYRIRRATLRLELVRQDSNPKFAFYMFKRLNTGGEPLSNQEARNCSVRLLGTEFIDFLNQCCTFGPFLKCTEDVTEEYRERMGLSELSLRFFAFKNNLEEYVHDIDPFLTEYMERVTSGEIAFNYEHERDIFEKTFTVLADTLGEKTGRRWAKQSFSGGFSVSHFEAFTVGVSKIVATTGVEEKSMLRLTTELENAKKEDDLKALTTGGGKNFRRLYEKKIEFVELAARRALE